ncbi:MAG TPA: 50S ribosomal protein L15 [Candidatus Moranbacteria bacterium]|nr:50S ribosomal protein L15 [Candidatus Moranbacteria bacterium]
MQIHEITTAKRKERKTVGRGGKRGTYSGRGNKGQKARSGGSVDPLFEGGRSSLVERLKKVRGFKSMHPKKVTVKLSALDKAYADGETVSLETLVAKGIVAKKDVNRGAKIVATGNLSKKLTIVGVLVSGAASEVIKQSGGSVE